ncbi:MAG: dicarboxylate/amino acid:cation symporter [Flavobacteriales bacterium]|nr:MAG: dicarboxylate/amino acid:cation symporter [Flavobacteriales bacterium]
MKKTPLHTQVIIGLILGTVYAFFAVKFDWVRFTIDYINPFGDIFINLLKLIAVPLVLFSIISGVISLQDVSKLGRMGLKTLAAYLLTTMFAVSLGLLLVNIFKPGEKVNDTLRKENRISYELWRDANPNVQRLDDICLSCDEANKQLVEQVVQRSDELSNDWVADKLNKADNKKKSGPLQALVDVVPSNIFKSLTSMAMLQIIFFAIFFGIVMVRLPKETREPVARLIDGLNEVFIKMVWAVMKAMPVFVFALMAGQIVKAAGTDPDKFIELLAFLGWYSMVVVAGLLLMTFVVYPIIVRLVTGKKIDSFLSGIRDAQITAFSTSSSVATLPVTMDCIQNKIGVSKPITSFVLPIGATVNMDGTSLYQAVAVVAMAQFHMIDLTIAQQLIIIITATLASIGAAAVPSAGLVLMIIVLESVGLNPAWIAIIFPVDRILDMCRTVVNVTGDATVSTIIAKSENQLNDPQNPNL